MNIKVQPVRELSNSERQAMEKDLVWANSSGQWNDDHWCITLHNKAVTLSVLVEQVNDEMFSEASAAVAA